MNIVRFVTALPGYNHPPINVNVRAQVDLTGDHPEVRLIDVTFPNRHGDTIHIEGGLIGNQLEQIEAAAVSAAKLLASPEK